MSDDNLPFSFNFKEWSDLYQQDKLGFEQKKQQLIEGLIQNSPSKHQTRLRGLQFQINSRQKLAKNPLLNCIKSAELMWNSVASLCKAMEDLNDTLQERNQNKVQLVDARVLEFKPQTNLVED